MEECQDNEKTNLNLDSKGDVKTIRKAQLSQQMIVCINQSITKGCAMKVQTRGEEYEIKVVNGAHEDASQEGPFT